MIRQLAVLVLVIITVSANIPDDQCETLISRGIAFACEQNTSPKCVLQKFVCDGVFDCANGYDESQTVKPSHCSLDKQKANCQSDFIGKGLDYHECGDGMCVGIETCRNGKKDCFDESDEDVNCPNKN
ncbi:uncharacterized protein LOC144437867 [Glandiceps talaboti]